MKIISIIYILSLLLFMGCSLFETENELQELEGKIVFSVTYDSTEIVQSHEGFLLLLKTEKVYTNCNYPLVIKKSLTSSIVDVRILGVDKDLEIVQPAECPARAVIRLNFSSKSYDLVLKYKSYEDTYSIKITDRQIEVNPNSVSFTKYYKFDFNF